MVLQVNSESPFASFPVEIIRLIFEFAGREDSLTASCLILVSRPARSWILPVLYETVVISKPSHCVLLHQRLSSSSTLAECVKNISIRVYEGNDDPYRSTVVAFPSTSSNSSTGACCKGAFQYALASILQSCQNASNLSLTLSLDRLFRAAASYPVPVDSPLPLPLQQLCPNVHTSRLTHLHCASWDSWLYFSQHLNSYARLTHLRVDVVCSSGLSDTCSILQHPTEVLPNLTHLAFGFDSSSSPIESHYMVNLVKDLLKRKRLESLVVLGWYCWDSAKITNAMSSITDARVRVLTSLSCLEEQKCFEEWNVVARGGKNVWDRAFQIGISPSVAAPQTLN